MSRRLNSSQSSNNRSNADRISGSAPSQPHVGLRYPVPTRPHTPEEQEKLRDRETRNKIFGRFGRFEGA